MQHTAHITEFYLKKHVNRRRDIDEESAKRRAKKIERLKFFGDSPLAKNKTNAPAIAEHRSRQMPKLPSTRL